MRSRLEVDCVAARLQKVTNLSDDLMVTIIHKWLVHRAHEAVGGVVGQIDCDDKGSVMVAQQK
jgi:hypothetical protein